jgi:hypothetical protein
VKRFYSIAWRLTASVFMLGACLGMTAFVAQQAASHPIDENTPISFGFLVTLIGLTIVMLTMFWQDKQRVIERFEASEKRTRRYVRRWMQRVDARLDNIERDKHEPDSHEAGV